MPALPEGNQHAAVDGPPRSDSVHRYRELGILPPATRPVHAAVHGRDSGPASGWNVDYRRGGVPPPLRRCRVLVDYRADAIACHLPRTRLGLPEICQEPSSVDRALQGGILPNTRVTKLFGPALISSRSLSRFSPEGITPHSSGFNPETGRPKTSTPDGVHEVSKFKEDGHPRIFRSPPSGRC